MRFLVIAAIALALTACTKQGGSPVSTGRPRLVAPAELSVQQRRFGVSPTRNSQVTYQPGVILVENGSEIIREVSGDGMTMTVDDKAVAQHDIQPGKIVFLT